MAVLNWSERGESPMRDCTYAAGLTGMVYAGWTSFVKGIYTHEEREALERSDDQPNETGASMSDLVLALKRRYGVSRAVNGAAMLSALLDRTGIGLVVQGKMGNLSKTGELRRWQPSFEGGHAVFVVNEGGGKYRWFDPLAPFKFAGDIVSKSQIMRYAEGIGYSMTFRLNEFRTYTQSQVDAKVAPLLAKIDALGRIISETQATLAATLDAAYAAQNAAATAEEKLADFIATVKPSAPTA